MGDSGLWVPELGLGTNNFGRRTNLEESRAVFHAALDNGLTFIDTADVYSAGQIQGVPRSATARPPQGRHRGHQIRSPAEQGSRLMPCTRMSRSQSQATAHRLCQSLYLHFPDSITPVEDTLRTLDDLRREGKLRWIGASNFAAWQIVEAEFAARAAGTARFVSAQNEYNVLNRSLEPELSPACVRYKVGLVAFRPLAHGFLTGKYQRGTPPPAGSRLAERHILKPETEFAVLDQIEAYAHDGGVDLLDVALGRVLAQAGVSCAIVGATTPAQIAANASAVDWHPTAADIAELDDILPLRLYPRRSRSGCLIHHGVRQRASSARSRSMFA